MTEYRAWQCLKDAANDVFLGNFFHSVFQAVVSRDAEGTA